MSMTHTAYFIAWNEYDSEVIGDPWPDPGQAGNWGSVAERVRSKLRASMETKMPEWKADLLDWGGLESCSEEIASRAPIQEIDTIRNLNFLGILNQAIEPANGYSFSWDVLKEGLATVIGREAADILVLGVRYEGRAWTFEPDLVSYQFGLILSEDVIKLHEQAQSVTSTTFTARLKEIDFSRIYPVYSHRLSAEFLPEAVAALDGLKDNLRDAKERGCGVLYLLD